MPQDQESEAALRRASGVAVAERYERGVVREIIDGRYFADGQPQVRETNWWQGTPEAWARSPEKAGGHYNAVLTGFGLVLALRSRGF